MQKIDIIPLIKLLDDPDSNIYNVIHSKLLTIGVDIIPELEDAWQGELSELLQSRIEDIIHEVQFNRTKDELAKWLADESDNLLKGVYWIATHQFPDLSYEELNKKVEQIKYDVWLELNDNLTALEKVKILNHIVFDIHKFSGNISSYYSPRNSYINQLLEFKKGNSISLSILYLEIASRLDLPIYGINLSENFVLAYADKPSLLSIIEDKDEQMLFYINAFKKGTVFGRKEIDLYVKQKKLKTDKSFYLPCNNVDIVQRLILDLVISYEKLGFIDKVEELHELFKIVK